VLPGHSRDLSCVRRRAPTCRLTYVHARKHRLIPRSVAVRGVFRLSFADSDNIGSPAAINLVDPDLYSHGDPFAIWRWLRLNDPVHWQPAADLPGFWALTKYDNMKAAYRDHATFSSAQGVLLRSAKRAADPGGGRTLALTDPPRHRQVRGLVDDWFTLRLVRAIEEEARDVISAVISAAVERETCDFVTDIAARIPLYVICNMMGVPRKDWEYMFTLTNQGFGSAEPLTSRLAHLSIMQYFSGLADERAKSPGDDLVSALVTGEADGIRLGKDDVLLNCDNLLVGGTENTRITAAGGMLAFIQHPDQWRALAEDPALLDSAIEEVLRWTSTATHIMRTATRPVVIRGCQINEGDRVTLWTPSANRDEEVFEDPEVFSIQRQPNRHLALGAGEHFCLGSTLARVELRLLYQELLRRTERVELNGPPVMVRSIVVNGLEQLPVRLISPRSAVRPGPS
jgi:cytochrome P450